VPLLHGLTSFSHVCALCCVSHASGRLLHHLAEVSGFKLSGVEIVVFDEADRMFEMGFAEQVRSCWMQPRNQEQSVRVAAEGQGCRGMKGYGAAPRLLSGCVCDSSIGRRMYAVK
jgi:hypothetical protein